MKPAFGALAIACALSLLALRPAAGDAAKQVPSGYAAAASNALVRALLKPDLATLAPEAAIKRFAKFVTLEPSQPLPGMLLLTGGDIQQRLELRYEPNAGGPQRFAQAALRISPPDPDAHYRDLERSLRKKLGKPRYERRDDGPLPTIGWRLGRLEVALSQTATRTARLVEVSIANPQ